MPREKAVLYGEDLVRAVLREVAARGPAMVSLDAVARELHVSPATFYRRYPNRRDLLLTVFEQFHSNLVDQLDVLYGEYPEGEPFNEFWRTLTKLLAGDVQGRAFMRLYLERSLFLPEERRDPFVPATLEWWLVRNERDLGPAPAAVKARIVWGFLFALVLARDGSLERNPTLVRTLGAACEAALRAGMDPSGRGA
jgi:AcrR family transcriptional regulator